ncbi:MAG: copper amine oxidase N-terminal domain-containing protein [Clostridia bacterium]|nr:copper amine oxidase N-terminal domain-containing protein [Clostridia bacterium]
MKKTATIILVLIMTIFLLAPSVSADRGITVFLNGTNVQFDAPPILVDGHTFVSVSAIAKLLGADISWIEDIREIQISLDGNTLNMFIDSTYMEYNMIPIYSNAAPFISDGRTMVPLRIISEYFCCTVDYNDAAKQVNIYTKKPVFYSFESNVLDIYSKYSPTQDIMVRLKQVGTNQLFDFSEIYLISNYGHYVKSNLLNSLLMYQSSTDWHAPFIINAVNNPFSYEKHTFTGGNHGYSGNYGGPKTARLESVYIEADGKSIPYGSGYCNALRVTWTNLVQASNTKEPSGWGREVMKETHVLTFDGDTFYSDVTLTPLEDIEIDLAYGFSAEIKYNWDDNIEYENPTYKVSYPCTEASNSGEPDCISVTCTRGHNALKMSLDTTFGLGTREHTASLTNSAFFEDYGKVYFNIINGKPLQAKAGEQYCYRGAYKFYYTY